MNSMKRILAAILVLVAMGAIYWAVMRGAMTPCPRAVMCNGLGQCRCAP